MKKLILLLVLGTILYGGYTFYNSSTGQETIETTQMARLGYEIVNEKDPSEVLSIIDEKEDVVDTLLDRNYVTPAMVADFKGMIKEFEEKDEPVDKRVMAEKYLKDKATPDKLQEILEIIDQDDVSIGDINEIRKLLE